MAPPPPPPVHSSLSGAAYEYRYALRCAADAESAVNNAQEVLDTANAIMWTAQARAENARHALMAAAVEAHL